MILRSAVNIALSLITDKCFTVHERQKKFNAAIAILTFTAVVFRSEIVLLLGPLALQGLFLRRTNVFSFIRTVIMSGLLSLGPAVETRYRYR